MTRRGRRDEIIRVGKYASIYMDLENFFRSQRVSLPFHIAHPRPWLRGQEVPRLVHDHSPIARVSRSSGQLVDRLDNWPIVVFTHYDTHPSGE